YFTVNNRYARSSEELTDQKLLFTTPSIDMEFTVVDNNKVKMTFFHPYCDRDENNEVDT
ncbi:MAG: hypothetical protein ACI909_003088, partial [Planctomycetota bacterium]